MRNVRNFWIEIYVDGKKTKVACGPRNKDGGALITVKQRSGGTVTTALEVCCTAEDNDLETHAEIHKDSYRGGNRYLTIKTKR